MAALTDTNPDILDPEGVGVLLDILSMAEEPSNDALATNAVSTFFLTSH